MKRSPIRHWQGCVGIFAPRPFGSSTVVGCNCGSLVFAALCIEQNTVTTCRGRFMEDTRRSFQMKVHQFHEQVRDSDKLGKCVQIGPAPICAMTYSNIGGYRPEDEAPELRRGRNFRKFNAEFSQKLSTGASN